MNIIDFIVSNFNEFLSFTGFANATVGNIIMIVVGIFFIWLAIHIGSFGIAFSPI